MNIINKSFVVVSIYIPVLLPSRDSGTAGYYIIYSTSAYTHFVYNNMHIITLCYYYYYSHATVTSTISANCEIMVTPSCIRAVKKMCTRVCSL